MTMKRRSLLKAAGLAAIVDVEQVAADRAGTARGTSGPEPRSILRLAGVAPVDGHLLASFARGPAVGPIEDLPTAAEPSAAGAVLSDAATVRVYRGLDDARVVPELRELGFRDSDLVPDGEAVVRPERGRVRLVVAVDDAVMVGKGPEAPAVASLLVSLSATDASPLDDTVPTVIDRLGDGDVAVIERPGPARGAASGLTAADDPGPVLTGERVALRDGVAALRRVAVYPSREASLAARERDWGPWPADGQVERDGVTRTGRTVVRDATASDPGSVLTAGH